MSAVELQRRILDKESVVEAAKNAGTSTEDAYDVWHKLFSTGSIDWSPYSLVQERVKGTPCYPWKVAVLCALMNRTHARQVRPIVRPLFWHWPFPKLMAYADGSLADLIRPLGFANRRSKALVEMSRDYESGKSALECAGVGQFGRDAIRIFVENRQDIDPDDGFLGKYVRWKRTGEVLFDRE